MARNLRSSNLKGSVIPFVYCPLHVSSGLTVVVLMRVLDGAPSMPQDRKGCSWDVIRNNHGILHSLELVSYVGKRRGGKGIGKGAKEGEKGRGKGG